MKCSIFRIPTKSDEEEDEYFDVSESEPPELPMSPPPTLVSEILTKTKIQQDTASVLTTKPSLPKAEESSSTKIMLPKISPIILPAKPSVPSPKPVIRVTPSEATGKGVDSVVTRVKPTVPFKPIRTSLMPKDALPNKGNLVFVSNAQFFSFDIIETLRYLSETQETHSITFENILRNKHLHGHLDYKHKNIISIFIMLLTIFYNI